MEEVKGAAGMVSEQWFPAERPWPGQAGTPRGRLVATEWLPDGEARSQECGGGEGVVNGGQHLELKTGAVPGCVSRHSGDKLSDRMCRGNS